MKNGHNFTNGSIWHASRRFDIDQGTDFPIQDWFWFLKWQNANRIDWKICWWNWVVTRVCQRVLASVPSGWYKIDLDRQTRCKITRTWLVLCLNYFFFEKKLSFKFWNIKRHHRVRQNRKYSWTNLIAKRQ